MNTWEEIVHQDQWLCKISDYMSLEISQVEPGKFDGALVSHGEACPLFFGESSLEAAKLRVMKVLHELSQVACLAACK